MGTFSWTVEIQGLEGGPALQIEAMADTGASYTMLPSDVLRELGITATRQGMFELADNRMVEMGMAAIWATVDGESTTTIVLFGGEGTPPLLGAYTLEGLLLAVDSVNERLVPTHGILY